MTVVSMGSANPDTILSGVGTDRQVVCGRWPSGVFRQCGGAGC